MTQQGASATGAGSAEVLGEGRFLRLVRRGGWEVAERQGGVRAVMIVATMTTGELVLVRQYRAPVEAEVVELAAGLVDAGETPVEAAERELGEECGLTADTVTELFEAPSSPGMSSERILFVRARGCRRTGPGGGIPGEEQITTILLPPSRVLGYLRSLRETGVQFDARVLAALALLDAPEA